MKTGMEQWKRGLSAALALAVGLGLLAGCGDKRQAEQNANPGGEDSGSTDFVYVASYVPIQGEFTGTLRNPVYANGSLYCTGQERVWVPVDPSEEHDVILFEAEEDVAAAAMDVDIMPVAEEEYSGYWNYSTAIYKIELDGRSKKIPFTQEESVEEENMSVGSSLSGISVAGNGDIYTMEEVYRSWSDAPEGMTWEDPDYYNYYHGSNSFILKRIDEEGNVLSTVDLSGLNPDPDNPDSYFYIYDFKVDTEGNIYTANDSNLYILDSDGNLKNTIAIEDGNINNMLCTPAGEVLAILYSWSDTDGRDSTRLVKLDPEATELEEGISLPSIYNMTPGGGEYDFYYTNGINFFGFRSETGETQKLLNWISCDVNPSYANGALVLEDGRVVALNSYYDYSPSRSATNYIRYEERQPVNELIILTKTPADQVRQKETITLATQYLNYNMRSTIIDFNRSNDKYRVEVLDYSEYNTDEDYSAGVTKLKTEILSGKMPDLLNLNQLPTAQLAGKKLLEDLYPFIENDPALHREDYLENVLAACEIDGKLYQTVSSFTVETLMGPAALVGDTPGWTVDQFQEALRRLREQQPNATALNQYTTRSDIFLQCLYQDMDYFVDWSSGKCNFDSEAFLQLLEFANSFPTEFDWENYEWTEEDDEYYRLGHGLQLLAQMYLGGFDDTYSMRIYNKTMGGQAVFIGYPTSNGVGHVMSLNGSSYAMSSKCANKEAAWQFLRQFFTEDGVNAYGFPIHKAALRQRMEQAMEVQYQTDGNGNYLLDEDGAKIPLDYGTMGWGEFEVPGGPTTQAEADQIMALLESCTKIYNYDESILELVEELTTPYFEGERSAEDVAKQLQSRATLVVNEQR